MTPVPPAIPAAVFATRLPGHNERRRKTHTELQAEDEQKPPESRMNGSLLKAMRYSDYGKISFQGSPNMKHS
ncbi:hypothetical protein FH972_007054 [Carpinus fangiana]|uniref:Uncharacterized protein n=1 Tax=Carpinus fangiana TaxID=176857 RepID=A0A5N6QU63_9ROSI|nr:hypothetical protein FH972_007054 [Carpinus fangiana]